jgi:hypothetical protein
MNYQLLKKIIIGELILLFAQFQMGMSVNLFLTIPLTSPIDILLQVPALELTMHIVNGILIVCFGWILIGGAIQLKNATFVKLSLLAVAFVVVAIVSGFVFFLAGQDDSFSMVMAMSYISVFTIYFAEFYLISKVPQKLNELKTKIKTSM